ncbi:MAG TPA: L,D-transpeptidase [Thermoleophilia bacterium]|nr:L,D-transpeptidase [Thermoleophilia bacterium]
MTRGLAKVLAACAAIVVLAVAGFGVVHARAAAGGPVRLVALPTGAPAASPSSGPTQAPVPRWQVLKAVGPVVAYRRPSTSAPVKARFASTTASGYPSVFLVKGVRVVGDTTWYHVWLPIRPNESRGWIKEGGVSVYTTTARIVIRLGARRLTVYLRGRPVAHFTVAVGMPQLPTPTGVYYINQKLRPTTSGGPFGVLALGISAFQPRLPSWPLGGPVAIHGTNQDYLIGQAVSHGCVRMHNADVLRVSALVPTGSPVVILK